MSKKMKRKGRTRLWFGLGLFAITVAKVLLIDQAEVDLKYRVLSAVTVGLLLIGSSVAYAKIAPRLAARPAEAPGG